MIFLILLSFLLSFILLMLFPTLVAEQHPLVIRRNDLKMIPLITAFVQAHAAGRIPYEFVLGLFQLEEILIKLHIHRAGVEQELVRRDTEQRLCVLCDPGEVEVLDILTGKDYTGIFLSDTL